MSSDPRLGQFKVSLTGDAYDGDRPRFDDIDLGILCQHKHISCTRFAEHRKIITPDQIGDAQGVIVLSPHVTRESVRSSRDLLAFGRFGVGYDSVDVKACTEADVLVSITAGAVGRSMAESIVTWMLALSHNVKAKDELIRRGAWDERSGFMGKELRDRTLGVVGLGRIGRALVKLLDGFGMQQPCASDPYIEPEIAQNLGVRLVDLDEVMRSADFVSVNCPLNEETRGLIGSREIGLMKPHAYLINTARGGIVDEDALYEALKNQRIAGAGVDVFVGEPVTEPHRFAELDKALFAPHCIGWTNEMYRDIWRAACQGMIDLSVGKRPKGVVNPEVFDRPGFRAKWDRLSVRV